MVKPRCGSFSQSGNSVSALSPGAGDAGSVQPQVGDVARVLLEFAALDLFDDLDEPLVGPSRQSGPFALAHDEPVQEFDLGAAALCHVLPHRRALLGRAAALCREPIL